MSPEVDHLHEDYDPEEEAEHRFSKTTLREYKQQKPRVFVPMRLFPCLKEWVRDKEATIKLALLKKDNAAPLTRLYGLRDFKWGDGSGNVSMVWAFDYDAYCFLAFTDKRGTRFEVGHELFAVTEHLRRCIKEDPNHTTRTIMSHE